MSIGSKSSQEAAVRAVLGTVDDPILLYPITELGIVRGVAIDASAVVVAVAHPLEDRGQWGELATRIKEAVLTNQGVEVVEVDARLMNDEERIALARILKGDPPANPLAVVDVNSGPPPPRPRINPFLDSRTRIIAIASGKGGVGKSSVTTNLSIALAERGNRVAVIDADVWGFSLPRMLGVDRPPDLIDDVIVPPVTHGVSSVSMGFFTAEDQAVIWRGPMLHKALEQFITDVHWGEPDYLVVDLPPGTGDISLSIAEFLPRAEVVIVTTPQPAAQKVAQRAGSMADKVNLTVVGVIENMSWFRGDDGVAYDIFGAGGGQELADQLEVPLLGQVPLSRALRAGGDEGVPIVVSDPAGEASGIFRSIAERIDVELRPTRRSHPDLRIG